MAIIESLQITNAGKGVEKGNHHLLLVGIYIGVTTMANSMEVPQSIKIQLSDVLQLLFPLNDIQKF